jgi:hypothetical protein
MHDREPPGPRLLRVHGKCEFPTEGYSVELKRSEPQGISPRDLLLHLIVHEPTDPVANTEVDADYEEETNIENDTVRIQGYVSISVEVV